MVSTQHDAWSPKPTDDGRLQPWYSLEFVCPHVLLTLTETGETLHNALNLLPQVSYFTLLETSGLQNAAYASLHYDVNGLSANGCKVAIGRKELIIVLERGAANQR